MCFDSESGGGKRVDQQVCSRQAGAEQECTGKKDRERLDNLLVAGWQATLVCKKGKARQI